MRLIKNVEQRLEFLDALRGIAAAYVAVYHTILIPTPHLAVPDWGVKIFLFGGSGVSLFFIVSAFSLSMTMPLHAQETPDLRAFYIRRFFRIAPLFYFMIIITLIRDRYYYNATHSIKEIFCSLSFLFNFSPSGYVGFVWASWTISVEMIFYVIFPFLYKVVNNKSSIVIALMASLIVSIFAKEIVFYISQFISIKDEFWNLNFFRHIPIFMFGIIGYYIVSHREQIHITPSVGVVLVLGSFYGFYSLLNDGLNFLFVDSLYWQGIFYTMLLVGVSAWPTKIIVNRFTCFLGKISYSTYLTHPTIILFLFPIYKWIYVQPLPNTLKFVASVALTAICVVAVSYLTFALIERLGIAAGRWSVKWAMGHHLLYR